MKGEAAQVTQDNLMINLAFIFVRQLYYFLLKLLQYPEQFSYFLFKFKCSKIFMYTVFKVCLKKSLLNLLKYCFVHERMQGLDSIEDSLIR